MRVETARFLFAVLMLSVALSGCSKDKEDLKISSGLAARIQEAKITTAEVDEKFEQLSDQQKDEYGGREGRANLVERLIEEEVLYKEAKRIKMDERDGIKRTLEDIRRSVLVSEYYKQEIVGKVNVSEDEIREYYEAHQDQFTTRALVKAQHILVSDSLKAVMLKKQLDAGASFGELAASESEDEVTAAKAGNIGYFNPGGYIRGIGYSDIFSEAVRRLEIGVVSDVVAHERGYSIIRVNERTPEKVEPLSEARKRIVQRMSSQKAKETYESTLGELKKKYGAENYIRERLDATKRTPEELWEVAQIEDDPSKRIAYYRELADNYPDHQYASQALFMMGFVWAEEEKDLVEARKAFNELIRNYPDSDVVESAKWMMENLDKPHPKFESVEGMMQRMKEDKGKGDEGKE